MSTTPKTPGQLVEEITQAKRDQEAERERLAEADQELQALTLWTVPDLVEALAHGRVHIAPGHDPALTAPTSAWGALDLAWNLAYPVKEGQELPSGTEYLLNHGIGYNLEVSIGRRTIGPHDYQAIRTLDPLPDPEPGWLDAPAVLATDDRDRRGIFFPVADRDEYWQSAQTGLHYHWSDLTDVTPLYPKEDPLPDPEPEVREHPVTIRHGDRKVGVGRFVWHPGGASIVDVEPCKSDTLHDAPRWHYSRVHYDRPWGTRLGGDPA